MKGFLNPYLDLIDKKPVSLTKDAYWLLLNQLSKFISEKPIDEQIEENTRVYQKLLLESI